MRSRGFSDAISDAISAMARHPLHNISNLHSSSDRLDLYLSHNSFSGPLDFLKVPKSGCDAAIGLVTMEPLGFCCT